MLVRLSALPGCPFTKRDTKTAEIQHTFLHNGIYSRNETQKRPKSCSKMTKIEILSKRDTKLLKNVFQNVNGVEPGLARAKNKSTKEINDIITPGVKELLLFE